MLSRQTVTAARAAAVTVGSITTASNTQSRLVTGVSGSPLACPRGVGGGGGGGARLRAIIG